MSDYAAPLDDIRFTIDGLVDLDGLTKLEPYGEIDADSVQAVLEEFGRLMAEVWAPTNVTGDTVGSHMEGDGVVTPEGFKEAYQAYADAGWGAVPFEPEYGGGGFPWVVGIAMQEMLNSANMALAMAPLLTQGAIDAILFHGSEEQREVYLKRMVSGEWAGSMNLTEPDAGSDVGALRTRAVRQDDGSYRITGQKIYITFGEHDLTENIVHLVLARTPDAPTGTKGISCFIVPKYLVEEDGSLGERNDVKVVSLEHKMGIKASPTCVLAYGDESDGAVGYLIGEENAGMRYMFTMMNNARLGVGVEGLGLAERSYQQALDYAKERHQGYAPGAARGEKSLIVDHPDVRRNLLTMRSVTEAMRALAYTVAEHIDIAKHASEEADRTEAQELVDLLIPLAKSWCTDEAERVTSIGIQVHGGMGYIEETGAAQHYRDAKITQIYEGTNGIQAMDLVGRKMPMRAGGVFTDQVARMRATVTELEGAGDGLAPIAEELAKAVDATESTGRWLMENGMEDPVVALSAATPFQRLFALTAAGWLMGKQALLASRRLDAGDGDSSFLEEKLITARFFARNVLPEVHGLVGPATSGKDDLMGASF
ncbi:acyl-CoA dehydrogenase [Iamia majanohamensis]|uniref:3-methylmercaptopropionyl-CoA dehydrogenase n=1 Tax=Iamia majanohamensis TaxID=467976 RepID=A0AAF0BUH2_9ACTN|nr:acyl-CoA dehydrogenase [Iamia majanohamensis]WCO65785.1 acyl-CoA dehydrogenase [Iamia majanohamensis]